MSDYVEKIATELKLENSKVRATLGLLSEGATIPFIARYRKEVTGSLDEVVIAQIRDRQAQLEELDKRRQSILESLTERNLLTDELKAKIEKAVTLTELEDVYLPYRPKRKTRASAAREKGLEPLAKELFAGSPKDPPTEAARYIDAEKGVTSAEDALAGARDIIAEWIAEDEHARKEMRKFWFARSSFSSLMVKGKETEGAKFKDYFDWTENVTSIPSHRILAMLRGETEGFLKLKINPPEEEALQMLERRFVKGGNRSWEQCRIAAHDSYKRLLAPAMETELRAELKGRADEGAIDVFVRNVRELLMAPPLGQKAVLAVDPGFRTGCKIVCLDRQGALLHHDVIYPLFEGNNQSQASKAEQKVIELLKKYSIEAIALGNGTASRETESFLRGINYKDAGLPNIPIVVVNESGASIYSASEIAREEFGDYDITVRGAVSIGRRLMDPLAELVKIDPKSIGVGQYQHDVDQTALQRSLDDTVISCVNAVGVELNTASKQLLSYVSGLGPQIAANIVKYRDENGAFASRAQLKKVPRLGPKAFEQCAGFLRIRDAKNPLDTSAVHPERYELVERMAKDAGFSVAALINNESNTAKVEINKYVDKEVGLPTLKDIIKELEKPGRDPRSQLEPVKFADGIHSINDLREGMRLPGIVTNVTAFGAFVDIGVHQDGLVHVSELADKFIKDPSTFVKVNQQVNVVVMQVDKDRKRISLSMKRK
ncbi:MAG: RNA-binding transcriptional accessory protein [Candidatus Melainabacteria bacterium]|nr:MAG: RNA-binding transcriptional accessory protein [Candidatus Melainabacteria bacterium]